MNLFFPIEFRPAKIHEICCRFLPGSRNRERQHNHNLLVDAAATNQWHIVRHTIRQQRALSPSSCNLSTNSQTIRELHDILRFSPPRLLRWTQQRQKILKANMPVTLVTANHSARSWPQGKVKSSDDLFHQACPSDSRRSKSIIQSSFPRRLFREKHITPSSNGFVRAAFHAYSGHHHLNIRPEDVWFSILSQLNFFINAHAEELRAFFVSHEGTQELEIKDAGSINYADFGDMAYRMSRLLQENIVDPTFHTWCTPSFSTTTDSDRVVASVLMMGALQKYFSYRMTLDCGIPSVTLLGEREDWEEILNRLNKLPELGSEPATFSQLLKPIIRKFIASFETPQVSSVTEFWSKIAHETGGSGPFYLSGWITAFCFWDEDGKSLYKDGPIGPVSLAAFEGRRAGCELDGVLYHRVNTQDIPCGFVSVPVTVDDNGEVYHTKMVAGSFGIEVTSSGGMLDGGADHDDDDSYEIHDDGELVSHQYTPGAPTEQSGLDTVQPLSGWLMYEKESEEDAAARETRRSEIEAELEELSSRITSPEYRLEDLETAIRLHGELEDLSH